MAINNPVITSADTLQGIAEEIQAKDGGGKMLDTEMRGRIAALPVADPNENLNKYINGTITEIETPATAIRDNAFMGLRSLNYIVAKNVISIGNTAFYASGMSSTNAFRFESCEIVGTQAFRNMDSLPATGNQRIVLFPKLKTISGNSFQSSNMYTGMTERILKQKCVLTSADVTGGYSIIYVPSALLSWYQNATNWVDRLNNYPNSIKTIEDNLSYLISRGYTEEELLKVEYDENEVI